jgi:hypothetical protein
MAETELRNQELTRHEEKIDPNVERHQAMNLDEKKQGNKSWIKWDGLLGQLLVRLPDGSPAR